MIVRVSEQRLEWSDRFSIYLSPAYLKWHLGCRATFVKLEYEDGSALSLPFCRRSYPTGLVALNILSDPFDSEGKLHTLDEDAWEVVLRAPDCVADLVQCESVSSMTLRHPRDAVWVPIATVQLDLTREEEALWMGLHPRHRSSIRRAMRQSLDVRVVSDKDEMRAAYLLMRDTQLRNDNAMISESRFFELVRSLPDNVVLFGVYSGNELQGTAIYPYSNHSASYLYGGSLARPADGALKFLHWEAMLYFRKRGVMVFDLQGMRIDPEKGSKYEGLRRFKERFGGEVVNGYLWRVVQSPMKYRFHRLVQHLVSIVRYRKLSYSSVLDRIAGN